MKKPKSSLSAPKAKLPAFMENDVGAGSELISLIRAAWPGDDGISEAELDGLEKKNRSARTALLTIARKIVESHSKDRKGNSQRVEDVVFLMLEDRISARRSKGGRPTEHGDEDILIEIGREHFIDLMNPKSIPRQFTKIYHAAADRVHREATFLRLDRQGQETRIRTLRRKFAMHKNEIMLKVAPSDEREFRRFVEAINSAIAALTELGLIDSGRT